MGGKMSTGTAESEQSMTNQPKRIQRKRTKGWQMPPNTVYVGRPTKWGNPWKIAPNNPPETMGLAQVGVMGNYSAWLGGYIRVLELDNNLEWIQDHIHELRGKNLACWCPLDQPCHADILLRLANEGEDAPV
jgi:hypothetical protein